MTNRMLNLYHDEMVTMNGDALASLAIARNRLELAVAEDRVSMTDNLRAGAADHDEHRARIHVSDEFDNHILGILLAKQHDPASLADHGDAFSHALDCSLCPEIFKNPLRHAAWMEVARRIRNINKREG